MNLKTTIVFFVIIFLCYLVCNGQIEMYEIIQSHHVYVRQTELKQAALEARIETLERIGIEIELKQRDGIWLVTGMSTQQP